MKQGFYICRGTKGNWPDGEYQICPNPDGGGFVVYDERLAQATSKYRTIALALNSLKAEFKSVSKKLEFTTK